jgi:hypothetical protein
MRLPLMDVINDEAAQNEKELHAAFSKPPITDVKRARVKLRLHRINDAGKHDKNRCDGTQ